MLRFDRLTRSLISCFLIVAILGNTAQPVATSGRAQYSSIWAPSITAQAFAGRAVWLGRLWPVASRIHSHIIHSVSEQHPITPVSLVLLVFSGSHYLLHHNLTTALMTFSFGMGLAIRLINSAQDQRDVIISLCASNDRESIKEHLQDLLDNDQKRELGIALETLAGLRHIQPDLRIENTLAEWIDPETNNPLRLWWPELLHVQRTGLLRDAIFRLFFGRLQKPFVLSHFDKAKAYYQTIAQILDIAATSPHRAFKYKDLLKQAQRQLLALPSKTTTTAQNNWVLEQKLLLTHWLHLIQIEQVHQNTEFLTEIAFIEAAYYPLWVAGQSSADNPDYNASWIGPDAIDWLGHQHERPAPSETERRMAAQLLAHCYGEQPEIPWDPFDLSPHSFISLWLAIKDFDKTLILRLIGQINRLLSKNIEEAMTHFNLVKSRADVKTGDLLMTYREDPKQLIDIIRVADIQDKITAYSWVKQEHVVLYYHGQNRNQLALWRLISSDEFKKITKKVKRVASTRLLPYLKTLWTSDKENVNRVFLTGVKNIKAMSYHEHDNGFLLAFFPSRGSFWFAWYAATHVLEIVWNDEFIYLYDFIQRPLVTIKKTDSGAMLYIWTHEFWALYIREKERLGWPEKGRVRGIPYRFLPEEIPPEPVRPVTEAA